MALKRLVIDGFGQLELNNVFFRRSGAIEAQCFLDSTDFASVPAENGMLLAVDRVNRTLKFPVDNKLPIAINYSTEHMYDERKPGLKNFKLEIGDFLPRMGYLSVGELFTTNCICYESTEFSSESALISAIDALGTTPLYGQPCKAGAIQMTATAPTEGVTLKAVEKTTMPDGQLGVKFQVIVA